MIRGGSEEANKELGTFLQRREEAQESRMARKRVNEADGEKCLVAASAATNSL